LEYFAPAVQLGLTATPKRRDNVDTYAYFGEPVIEGEVKTGKRYEEADFNKIIDAEKGDLFDVLAHVAYPLEPLSRQERADRAMAVISTQFNTPQQVFCTKQLA
jgi:hypothetical protein